MSATPPPAKSCRFRQNYWFFPVVCGLIMCALQIVLALYRFDVSITWFLKPATWMGLGLFFVTGGLIGILIKRLLQGTGPRFRIVLLAAAVLATPIAVYLSLFGGLFGPIWIVICGLVPHLLLLGILRLIGKLWQLWKLPSLS